MTLLLRNLDEETRALVLAEVAQDIAAGRLSLSSRLSPAGSAAYPALLTEAVRSHDARGLQASFVPTAIR